MTDTPLQSTKREMQRMFSEPRLWAAMAGAALLLGMVGPFGTFDELRLLPRIAYWAAVVLLTYAAGVSTVYFLVALFFGPRTRNLLAYLIAGAVAGLPVAAVVIALNSQLEGAPSSLREAMPLVLYCMAIAAVVSLLIAIFSIAASKDAEAARVRAEAAAPAAPPASPPAEPQRPAILDRLPLNLRGRLAYMSMQDHYVEVHTDKGGTLVLMRLADAIAETGGVPGLQIHRSHWVATAAVASVLRKDGRLLLKMADGTELPVSRSYMAAVRDAGLAR